MKAYLVKTHIEEDLKIDDGWYKIFYHEPWYNDKKQCWQGTSAGFPILKKQIHSEIKLPKGKEITEIEVSIVPNNIKHFTKGCLVGYSEFNLGSFLFGGMIYGGYHDHYTTELLGIDWYNKKILVQKHNKKTPKWYDWNQFSIEV